MDDLDAPLSSVLPAPQAALFAKELGVETVRDLLWHLPRKYADRGQLTPVRDLVAGDNVTIVAKVRTVSEPRWAKAGKLTLLQVTLTDGQDDVGLTFFGKHLRGFGYVQKAFVRDRVVLVSGKVEVFNGRWQLSRPDFQPVEDTSAQELTERPVPLYPATGKLPSWKIADVVAVVLDTATAGRELPDVLPPEVVVAEGLVGPLAALRAVHAPRDKAELARGRRRLRYEEAFILQTALAQRRADTATERAVPRVASADGIAARFEARLPFALTGSQREVGAEIAADLARDRPMQRLLQGDVGSGKTLVALRAVLATVDAGGQAALLAPTEVLASQHLRSITAMLGDLAHGGGLLAGPGPGTRVVLLTGSMGAAARRETLLAAASGEAGIVIGTHALLEEHVQFADLGLVVVDEQHRFGVEQRDALRAKASRVPHLLVMTATPIPRTVAMTVFGDLETSVLSELPPGRAEVTTVAVPMQNPKWVDRVWQRIAEEVALGRQAYVVCARIDGDDSGRDPDDGGGDEPPEEPPAEGPGAEGKEKRRPPAAVSDVVEIVRAHPATAGLRTEVLHGRLAPADKDEVMRRFAAGETDVVVSTTVVEVGVDVPNASVMVVVDADRFGISQLHQLRGRIGRGGLPGTCLLMSEVPPDSPGGRRLQALVDTRDGFELARLDLEQRREGDVLGAAQSGKRSSLRLLGVLADADVIADARAAATAVVAQDPDLSQHPGLAAAVADRVTGDTERFLERA